ncbi:short chain dehydrogenase/oxidoreductase CpoX2 [Penicillium concentricum]|uniref:Short chain dehydrogenase/oxidoreductase CpoX2 n=1 Tax=Penicillium concentricum TaxID=293559 RepID=A0A9W9SS36_9EURO|nr:short chain dehydrogenase/oxidoreductase CpoX2 [Penicillium concentricum]KAJ5383688.1 short chain dehydrogenase/oxidoreductase CpoX2 [Penicillium concentricum]
MASVTSKIFAITGGASGIGAATCRLLAQRGAEAICVGDLSSEMMAELKTSIQATYPLTDIHCTVLDVSSYSAVNEWIDSIMTQFGRLDGAANIAGMAQGAGTRGCPTILEEDETQWKQIFQVNLDGVFYATKAEVRAMKSISRDRSIVNVASIASMAHMPDVFAYGTSKGACAYFTTCVAQDVIPFGIRVNTVSPGITRTPMLPKFAPTKTSDEVEEAYIKEGFSIIEPDDVARTIIWLLSEDSRPVFGANINIGANAMQIYALKKGTLKGVCSLGYGSIQQS